MFIYLIQIAKISIFFISPVNITNIPQDHYVLT